jgi:hypothetical protein
MQLATLFPVLFITVMTTTVRRWALYKAQTGAYLVELEQLHSSISLPSTIKLVWSLRSFGKLSAGLVFVWSFYYADSQAQKGEYVRVEEKPLQMMSLAWLRSDLPSRLGVNMARTEMDQLTHAMNENLIATASYTTLTSKDNKPYEHWGAPLTPVLETQLNQKQSSEGFITSDKQHYAAYSGLNVYVRDPSSDYEDTSQYVGYALYHASYILLSCNAPQLQRFEEFPNGTLPGTDTAVNMTKTNRAFDSKGKPTRPRQLEIWGRWNSGAIGNLPAANGSFVSACDVTQSFVDVANFCLAVGCSGRAITYSEGYNSTVPTTPFDDDDFASIFFDNLLRATGPPNVNSNGTIFPGRSTTISQIIDLGSVAGAFRNSIPTADNIGVSLANSTKGMIDKSAQQLTALINTYYLASQTALRSQPVLCPLNLALRGSNLYGLDGERAGPIRQHDL